MKKPDKKNSESQILEFPWLKLYKLRKPKQALNICFEQVNVIVW